VKDEGFAVEILENFTGRVDFSLLV